MSVTSTPRSARGRLAQAPLSSSAQRPPGGAKGYRIVTRPVQPAPGAQVPSAQVPQPGLAGLWQRLCAALRVTPEQWYAHQLIRQTDQDVGQRVVMLSGGQPVLMTPRVPPASQRRPAQADLL